MREAYVNIKGVRTKITAFGTWIEETIRPNEHIVIIIPGNPGVTAFYNVFAKEIHDKLGYPVWIVGHAGHNIPENTIDPLPQESQFYTLQGQVQHKVDFIMKYVPEDASVHLIGHSIGSYMILEFLEEQYIKNKVLDAHLLFPTIENMRESNNGKFLTTFVKPFVWLIVFLAWIFYSLPEQLKNILLTGYCCLVRMSRKNIPSLKELIKPDLLSRVFTLAFEEMDSVRERNNVSIKNNVKKLCFVYGEKDGWTPRSYYNNLVCDISNVQAELTKYDHAFVLRSSIPLANLVISKIQTQVAY